MIDIKTWWKKHTSHFFILINSDIVECATEYRFEGISKGTKVLDIGVFTGGFSIIAEKYGATVIGIEPLPGIELQLNRFINRTKFPLIRVAHGDGDVHTYSYGGRAATWWTFPLSKIYEVAFVPDFLKMDTEGSEWTIKPEELKNIPRFEIEFHYFGDENEELINELEKTHRIDWTERSKDTRIAHGYLYGNGTRKNKGIL